MGEEENIMGRVWYDIFYHIVWTTKHRRPTITPVMEKHMYPSMKAKAAEMGCYIHACNGVDDHVHVVITIPPRLSVSDVVGQIKGASAHHVNTTMRPPDQLRWQRGFGVNSFARKDLPWIINYVRNQKSHHRGGTTTNALECTD